MLADAPHVDMMSAGKAGIVGIFRVILNSSVNLRPVLNLDMELPVLAGNGHTVNRRRRQRGTGGIAVDLAGNVLVLLYKIR